MKKYKRGRKYNKYKSYVIVSTFLIVICIIIWYAIKIFTINTDYVIVINKQYVFKDEFLLYLDEQERIFEEIGGIDIWETDFDGVSAREVAKNNTVNAISFIKVAVDKASELGIYLSEEERDIAKQRALDLKADMEKVQDIDIPISVYEKFIEERMIENRVYDYVTGSFVVDEKDFNIYLEENEQNIKNIILDYIFIQNNSEFDANEKALEIEQAISYETDFKNIEDLPFIEVYEDVILEPYMFEANIMDIIYKLSEFSISNVIENRNGFYIFKIKEISSTNSEQAEEMLLKEYTEIKKNEIYNLQINSWGNSLKIEKNREIWDNI